VYDSSVARGGHVPPPCLGCVGSWDSLSSEVFCFFGGVGRGDGGQTRQQTCIEKHLTTANCLYISGFRGLYPRPPPGLFPRTPLPSPRSPVPTLTSEPGYTTGV